MEKLIIFMGLLVLVSAQVPLKDGICPELSSKCLGPDRHYHLRDVRNDLFIFLKLKI